MPAEWDLHQSVWLAWPSHAELWQENLKSAQDEFTKMCWAISDFDPSTNQFLGEKLEVLVPDKSSRAAAELALKGLPVRFHEIPFGDIWLRDTGPIFLVSSEGDKVCSRFQFNGWGGKYLLPGDDQVGSKIIQQTELKELSFSWVLEGGSIDIDGEGTCLTTRQCLLNPNRNPELNQNDIENNLKVLGIEKVLWLKEGLLNDHTDGHIDNIARFVRPGMVICMEAKDADDPNKDILENIASHLALMTDAKGRKLDVIRIPSPGKISDEDGKIIPASYVNFYIGNKAVVVPIYGTQHDQTALDMISKCFPHRKTIGILARGILSGGGSFHCISQQEPI
jgi:agmatine deiminase